MPTFEEFLWETAQTVVSGGVDHLKKRMDATIPQPPALQMPAAPPMEAPTFAPPPWSTAGNKSAELLPRTVEPAPSAPPAEAWSYGESVPTAHSCVNCVRKHLGTSTEALKAAQSAAAAGNEGEARRQLVRAAAELHALEAFDLTPELLAATPEADRAVVSRIQPCLRTVMAQLPTPKEAALAFGSLDEGLRFAASPKQTDRDRAELVRRVQVTDSLGPFLERSLLSPSAVDPAHREQAWAARDAIRNGSHALDESQLQDVGKLESAIASYEQAAIVLTPVPDAKALQRLAEDCSTCQSQFYAGYLERLKSKTR